MIRKLKQKIIDSIINSLSDNEQFVLLIGKIVDVRIEMYLNEIKSKMNQ